MNTSADTHTAPDFAELAGRIEGISRAVLHLAATLEINGLIDGTRLSESWRTALAQASAEGLSIAHQTLCDMSFALEDARGFRESSGR